MRAVMASEPVEDQRGDAKARPDLRDAATQTPGDERITKKRKLEEEEEEEMNPVAALVNRMKILVDADLSAKKEFKREIDTLAEEILALKKF